MVAVRDDLLEEDCCVADISRLGELKKVREEEGGIRIGALVSFTQILESPLVKERLPVLHQACRTVGSLQIRNRATLAGNIANASPAGDSLPALFVHRALVRTTGRTIPVRELFTGVKKTVLENGEMILEIIGPKEKNVFWSRYFKSGPRQALAVSKASLAVMLRMDQGVIREARLAAGAVGATVIHPEKTERFLLEKKIQGDIIKEACGIIRSEVRPIDDFRSTAVYRSLMTERFLEEALRSI